MGVGSGGVSSAAYVHSPVPSEQRSVMQSTVDTATAAVETVKSYLPSLASLSLGGGKAEEQQEARSTGGEREAAVAGGAGGAATLAAASTAAAAATTDKDAAPTDSADHPASATGKDVVMADSTAKDGDTVTDTANQKARVMDEGKSSDIATSDRGQEERAAKTDTEAAEPGAGNEGSEVNRGSEQTETESSDQPKKKETGGSSMENKDAIPTAGGEKLGEKHWGESKMVPDLPPKRDSDAGAQVSSSEGQPDSMFLHFALEIVKSFRLT